MTNHEERDPTPKEPQKLDASAAAVRRLAAVAGAIVLLLLGLEAADALIIHALPLAGIAVVAALLYYVGFIARPPALRPYAMAGFAVAVGLFCVTAYVGWRGKHTALGLARVIRPVPEIVRVTRSVPDAELTAALALSVTLEAFEGAMSRQLAGQAPDTTGRARWARVAEGSNQRYWVVHADIDIPQMMAFYARPENRSGWTVVAERPEGLLSLRRGAEELLIMASDGFPHARSKIGYLYIGGGPDR
ncbi:MAG TPA: hypothetical protein VIL18_12720 [Longimicrobiales bacterium]